MSPPLSLTNDSRTRLEEALGHVERFATAGMHPTEAVVKAAEACRLGPNHAKSLARFYNTGKTAMQVTTEKDGGADFELADGDRAAELLGGRQKTAAYESTESSDHYGTPPPRRLPSRMKTAAFADPPEPRPLPVNDDRAEIRRLSQMRANRNKIAEMDSDIDARSRKVDEALDRFTRQFLKIGAPTLPTLLSLAAANGDEDLLPVLNEVGRRDPDLLKQAARAFPENNQQTARFFKMAAECRDASVALFERLIEFDEFNGEAAKTAEALLAHVAMPEPEWDLLDFERRPPERKIAFAGQTLLNMLVGGVSGRAAAAKPGPDSNNIKAYIHELDDPRHAQALRAIQTRSIVEQLMAGDKTLRGYSPDEVAMAYNELSRAAPGLQGNGLQMAALMRRYLAQESLAPDDIANNVVGQSQKAIENNMRALPQRPEYPGAVAKASPLSGFKDSLGQAGTFAKQMFGGDSGPAAPPAQEPKPKPAAPPAGGPPASGPPAGGGNRPDLQPTDMNIFDRMVEGLDDTDVASMRNTGEQTPLALL